MVVISEEVTNIFKILDMDIKTEQDLFSALVPRDLLLRVDVEQELTLLISSLKGKYKTSKLNCLHKNRDDKQKFPGINLVRQILRCNGYHLKPVIFSRGYCKHSGKKIVDRNFKIVRLPNYQDIKMEEILETEKINIKNNIDNTKSNNTIINNGINTITNNGINTSNSISNSNIIMDTTLSQPPSSFPKPIILDDDTIEIETKDSENSENNINSNNKTIIEINLE